MWPFVWLFVYFFLISQRCPGNERKETIIVHISFLDSTLLLSTKKKLGVWRLRVFLNSFLRTCCHGIFLKTLSTHAFILSNQDMTTILSPCAYKKSRDLTLCQEEATQGVFLYSYDGMLLPWFFYILFIVYKKKCCHGFFYTYKLIVFIQ